MYNKLIRPTGFWILLSCIWLQTAIAQKSHPYLFYTPEKVNRLKARLATDTLLANNWNALKQRCDDWLLREKGGNMEQLAFAYNMTGEVRYAERAKSLLQELVNKPQWDGMDDRTPRWNAGLGTSHSDWVASVTYDAIYNSLTKAERTAIAQKIVQLGIAPAMADWLSKDKRIQSLNNMGHNWWAAIVFEAGIASLAVMNEVPEAKSWAQETMEAAPQFFYFNGSVLENKPANFDPAGGFYESVNYANYGISEYLYFRLAWTNSFGVISKPYDALLQRSADWFMNTAYPRKKGPLLSLNFGDSNDFANAERILKVLIALGLGKDHYYWYMAQTAQNQFGEELKVQTPMGLLYQPENKTPPIAPPLPPSILYGTMGWGMLRNSWQPDATFLGVKCGFTWNHAHADAGSFVLYHDGENLLIDGGDVGYGNPEYSSYFVTSQAHNVVLFNGMAQDPQDQYHAVKNPGHLYNLLDGGNLKYLLADATGPTSRNFLRNYRNFLWVGKVILLIDDLHTYDIGRFDFLLHYADTAVKKGPDFEITKGKASVLFRPLYPEGLPLGYPHDLPEKMKFRTEYGIKDRTTNVRIPYYVLTPPENSDRTKLVNAILLLDSTNQPLTAVTGSSGSNASVSRSNLPVIEKMEGKDYIGIRITQNGQVTEVYVNLLADGRLMHRNSSINIDGWETDAYISAFTFPVGSNKNNPASLRSYFVSNGSYLRRNGKVLLSSLSKVFLMASRNADRLEVQLQGQPLIYLSLDETPKQLVVNGKIEKAVYQKDHMLLLHVDTTAEYCNKGDNY